LTTAAESVASIFGLMTTWKGTPWRSCAFFISSGAPSSAPGSSSMTVSCSDSPTCGAASPTPGASCMVSRISSMSCWISAERISFLVSVHPTWRRTG
jgi:hypothetical protein